MAAASEFSGMTGSIYESQDSEITLSKQPVLSEHGSEVRKAINQLPPETSQALLAQYGETPPSVVANIESAVTMRELAIENAEAEADIDQQWIRDGVNSRMDSVGLSNDDEWNQPA